MSVETLDTLVALGASSEPPTEFRIFAKGEIKTRKGPFVFDEKAATSVMKHAVEFAAEYALDYGHGMLGNALFGAADPAEGHKAAGWFKPEMRGGELWATGVTWTPTAAKKLRDREYRYVSPTFKSEGGRITELLNVALTNVPATKGLDPLVLDAKVTSGTSPAKERNMGIEVGLLAATVGLGTSATETEALGAVREAAELSREVGKLTGKDARQSIGVVMGWKDAATRTEALSAELTTLKDASKRKDIEAKVDAKIVALEVAVAEKDFLVQMGMSDPAKLDGYLSTRTFKVAASETDTPRTAPVDPKHRPAGSDKPTAEQLHALGMTAEEYDNAQKKMREQGVLR